MAKAKASFLPQIKSSQIISLLFVIIVFLLTIIAVMSKTYLQSGAYGCRPRPACLDAKVPCKIMEPAQGWCKKYTSLPLVIPTLAPNTKATPVIVVPPPRD